MNTFRFRTILLSLMLVLLLTPIYAHHGGEFLSKAMEMNTAELQIAEMAASKSQNASVKDFAQMLVQDHTKALEEIRQLRDARLADALTGKNQVDTKTTKNAAEVQLTPEHKRTSERLSSADFDREFIDLMVREHRLAIRDFEAQSHAHGNTTTTSKQKSEHAQNTTREKPTAVDQQKKYSTAELRQDIDTVDFANATLPTLRQHLAQAEMIQRELQRR